MNSQNTELFAQLNAGLHFNLSNDFGLIRATGDDARTFLHSQFTQDIIHLSDTDVRLGAYCSAKGRMYAIFYVWSHEDAVYLLMHRSVVETVIKRLRMFVLRAKVILEDISAQFAITAYVGADALTNAIKQSNAQCTRLGILPASLNEWEQPNLAREIRITPMEHLQPTTYAEFTLWQWLEIMAGIAHVTADISEAFVPQMMNLDRIGGVNFKKGCYPGQEVVARSHYLGKLKRRMQYASLTSEQIPPLTIGMDMYSSADDSQPAGQLLTFALNPLVAKRWDVLYEVSLPMLEHDAQLSISEFKATWVQRKLPYSLADEPSK
ncbi:MAG: folate-binding protein [Burkholderiales bacterium]|jgi:hypothetical protein|nr:folate-binding protein [Burkholderiales bacterium]MCE1177238.1 folate-binding protein [Burkholderiales bacterium]